MKNYFRGSSKEENTALISAERWKREMTCGTGFSIDIKSRKYAEVTIGTDAYKRYS
jgi:hypothetical protein